MSGRPLCSNRFLEGLRERSRGWSGSAQVVNIWRDWCWERAIFSEHGQEEKEVEEVWSKTLVEQKKLKHVLVLMNFSGSFPSRLMISGRIRLLALMNQVRTCFVVSSVFIARISVSARVGYALYLCWKSHSRKTIWSVLALLLVVIFPVRRLREVVCPVVLSSSTSGEVVIF